MNENINIPDFKGDDFANDKEIQKVRAEAKAYDTLVKDCLSIVRDKLNVKEAAHKNLKSFLMFKNLQATVLDSFKSTGADGLLHVSLVEYSSSYSTGKYANAGTDHYLFGHLVTDKLFPKTYVCKETIREKITDLFLRLEIDFEHSKKFSRKFHVLTEDKSRLINLWQFKNVDDLILFPELELEIHSNACLFRSSRRAISIEETFSFCELAKTLIKLLN